MSELYLTNGDLRYTKINPQATWQGGYLFLKIKGHFLISKPHIEI